MESILEDAAGRSCDESCCYKNVSPVNNTDVKRETTYIKDLKPYAPCIVTSLHLFSLQKSPKEHFYKLVFHKDSVVNSNN